MMYSKKFSVCIKVNGKVLREQGDEVAIPFGTEYSITLKNLNTVRAQVRVSIDGTDATEDTWLIVQPNSSINLERFIRKGDNNQGNRFKFIERSNAIEQYRGIKEDDGLVRVEYRFETILPPTTTVTTPNVDWYKYYDWQKSTPNPYDMWAETSYNAQQGTTTTPRHPAMNCVRSATMNIVKTASAGITVAGSKSNQSFFNVPDFECGPSEVIVLKLIGAIAGEPIKEEITVNHKPQCSTCGRKNKATNKFCSQCGTSLILF